MDNHNKDTAFRAVLKTLKENKVMVDTREDGIYIRLAGNPDKGLAFSEEFVRVYPPVQPNSMARYAASELDILVKTVKDPIIKPVIPQIIALAQAFGKSGQSGGSVYMSASAISQAVNKLLTFQPICKITGIEDEWMNVTEHGAEDNKEEWWQNKRCGAIFKNGKDAKPYYLDAVSYKPQHGSNLIINSGVNLPDGTKVYSRQYIKKFPFTPKTFYVDIIQREVAKDDWEYDIKDVRQLNRVFKYYDRY